MLEKGNYENNSHIQQFHQYQQNEQSPLVLIQWTHKKGITTNEGCGLGQA